jgi:Secretion system C-terminal sorting domain/PA domain
MQKKLTFTVGIFMVWVQYATAQVPEQMTSQPTPKKDTTFLAVYNYNARYELTPIDLGRNIPQPDLIADLVVAHDTVMRIKTVSKGNKASSEVEVSRSKTKISSHIKDKVAIIYLNESCTPTQTCLNAQRAGAKAVILIHPKMKQEEIDLHAPESDNLRDSIKIPCYTVSRNIGEKMISLLPSVVGIQKVKPKEEPKPDEPVIAEKPVVLVENPLKETVKKEQSKTPEPTAREKMEGIVLYPNPATDIVQLSFDFKEPVPLTVEIFNEAGQLVHTEQFKEMQSGTSNIITAKLTSGKYNVRLTTPKAQEFRRLIIVR